MKAIRGHYHRAESGLSTEDRRLFDRHAASRRSLANSTIRMPFLAARAIKHNESDLAVEIEIQSGDLDADV